MPKSWANLPPEKAHQIDLDILEGEEDVIGDFIVLAEIVKTAGILNPTTTKLIKRAKDLDRYRDEKLQRVFR